MQCSGIFGHPQRQTNQISLEVLGIKNLRIQWAISNYPSINMGVQVTWALGWKGLLQGIDGILEGNFRKKQSNLELCLI